MWGLGAYLFRPRYAQKLIENLNGAAVNADAITMLSAASVKQLKDVQRKIEDFEATWQAVGPENLQRVVQGALQ